MASNELGPLRRSAAATTFGPGAIVDFPNLARVEMEGLVPKEEIHEWVGGDRDMIPMRTHQRFALIAVRLDDGARAQPRQNNSDEIAFARGGIRRVMIPYRLKRWLHCRLDCGEARPCRRIRVPHVVVVKERDGLSILMHEEGPLPLVPLMPSIIAKGFDDAGERLRIDRPDAAAQAVKMHGLILSVHCCCGRRI